LWQFLAESGARNPHCEAAALAELRGQANSENVPYYEPGGAYEDSARAACRSEVSILRMPRQLQCCAES
jgi:hypothetical protein